MDLFRFLLSFLTIPVAFLRQVFDYEVFWVIVIPVALVLAGCFYLRRR